MGIDLLRGKKVGMAEPFRDVFHRNSLVAEKSCTAMTEIMESDMGHIVIIQKPLEACRNPVRSYQIPVFRRHRCSHQIRDCIGFRREVSSSPGFASS